mgnify:CR=1 FL=1
MCDDIRLFEIVKGSFDVFFARNAELLNVNANERSITHKLAEVLQGSFPDMDVDCEYNRHKSVTKRIPAYGSRQINADDLEAKTVYPDIVVHRRGTDDNNLLVIEVKKDTDARRNRGYDAEKLEAFTGEQYRYHVGLFIELDTQNATIAKVECYMRGRRVSTPFWTELANQAEPQR